jgi:hypothetical protein
MTDAALRPRDEWRWLISHRLSSIEVAERVFGPDALPITMREKRALLSLEIFINRYEADQLIEQQRRQSRR